MSTNAWKCACCYCNDIVKRRGCTVQRIVTGDETWVHHYEPASKCQSMWWKHTSSPRTKKFTSVPYAGKVMLMFCSLMGPSSSTTRIVDRRSVVHGIVLCLKKSWHPPFTIDAEECWQVELLCVMTTHGSSDRWNDPKTEIRVSPPHIIQFTSRPFWLP